MPSFLFLRLDGDILSRFNECFKKFNIEGAIQITQVTKQDKLWYNRGNAKAYQQVSCIMTFAKTYHDEAKVIYSHYWDKSK